MANPNRQVSKAGQRRTARRFAAVRIANPKALPHVNPSDGYTLREARRVKTVAGRLPKPAKKPAPKTAGKPYNPLAPLTGAAFNQEVDAATRLKFGDTETALKHAIASQDQTTANTGTYYDDYLKALGDSSARIKAANDANVAATEGRVDNSYQQDAAALAQRNAQASETAAKLGRGPVQSTEGAQAVEAQRSQGNQAAARLRTQAGADNTLLENRGSSAVLGKAQALARENAKQRDNRAKETSLAADKGAFKVTQRTDARKSEREWAAIQKEFNIKDQDIAIKRTVANANANIDKGKLATQKIVARIYTSGNKAKARAQIRVAELQLKKGKIDQHQFNTITNIYKGLPAKGVSPAAKGTPSSGGQGSGAGGSWAPWERDKITGATRILVNHKATANERATWLERMQHEGMSARLARAAWDAYAKKNLRSPSNAPDKSGAGAGH